RRNAPKLLPNLGISPARFNIQPLWVAKGQRLSSRSTTRPPRSIKDLITPSSADTPAFRHPFQHPLHKGSHLARRPSRFPKGRRINPNPFPRMRYIGFCSPMLHRGCKGFPATEEHAPFVRCVHRGSAGGSDRPRFHSPVPWLCRWTFSSPIPMRQEVFQWFEKESDGF